jgi:transcriptional regulator with XRE-family HTH domain
MKPEAYNLGKRILTLRKTRGLSREALADRADLNLSFLAKIEHSKTSPTVRTLSKIASGLGVSPAELLSDRTVTVPLPKKELLALEISGLLRSRNIKTILLVRSVVKELLKKLPKA